MEPHHIDLLVNLFIAVAVIGTSTASITVLLRTWFGHRATLAPEQVKKIMEALETIQGDIEDLRGDQLDFQRDVRDRVGEISGRVEFTERMLSKGGVED
ncbi:MAG: hypothetical protein O7I93_08910 [Gemmatimonadetes bacterium]|nr:hypothetical protein [Gemmatimonadota bacterium]